MQRVSARPWPFDWQYPLGISNKLSSNERETMPTRSRNIGTGEMRALLQPVRFLYLTEPAQTLNGPDHFKKGDHVAAQYWGNGVVRLTRVDANDDSVSVLAHSVHAAELTTIEEGTGEGN